MGIDLINFQNPSDISYFTDLRQSRGDKNIPKTALKTRLKTKETTCTLIS
jgi:hypothetical protein